MNARGHYISHFPQAFPDLLAHFEEFASGASQFIFFFSRLCPLPPLNPCGGGGALPRETIFGAIEINTAKYCINGYQWAHHKRLTVRKGRPLAPIGRLADEMATSVDKTHLISVTFWLQHIFEYDIIR